MNSKSLGASLALWALVVSASAATLPAAPAIENLTSAGSKPRLKIRSDVGTINRVLCATNLMQSNWVVLTNLIVDQGRYDFEDARLLSAPARFYRVVACPTNAPSGMALIPAGAFAMGDTLDGQTNAIPVHTLYVGAFYMDRSFVTKAMWDQVYQWATNHGYTFEGSGWANTVGLGKASTHPVQTVSWYNAVKWCNARSEKEGLAPCYFTNAAQTVVYRSGSVNLSNNWVKWTANGYRLPTEAEWEKAARGGAAGHRFPWTSVETIDWNHANYYCEWVGGHAVFVYDVNSTSGYSPVFSKGGIQPYTSVVGTLPANGFWLYDMAGNVHAWCWDWYRTRWYAEVDATQNDTRGPVSGDLIGTPPSTYANRVARGGSWADDASMARCASRNPFPPAVAGELIGFRCVRGL